MIPVAEILPAGTWEGAPADSVVLDREDRHRRRAVLDCAGGTKVLLDMPKAVHLHHGDGLRLGDGRIGVVALQRRRHSGIRRCLNWHKRVDHGRLRCRWRLDRRSRR